MARIDRSPWLRGHRNSAMPPTIHGIHVAGEGSLTGGAAAGGDGGTPPLSVQLGGAPSPWPMNPAIPGALPNTSHADCFGAPPSNTCRLSSDGSAGAVPNGVLPVTSSLLKSAAKAVERSYASPSGDTRGELVNEFAPRPHTMAAFCFPRRSLASLSTDRLPSPNGMRGTGTGTPGRSTDFATRATPDAPAAAGSVAAACVTTA